MLTVLWSLSDEGLNLAMSLRKIGNTILLEFADKLEDSSYVWLALFGLYYLGMTLLRSFRPLWFDELITYNVANLSGWRATWEALTHGADLNPPLFYLATRAAAAVFGVTELGLRVPSIAGFAVLCFCLYKFVSRRAWRCFGLVAMVLPVATGAYPYSSEAREYWLVLGLQWYRYRDVAKGCGERPSRASTGRSIRRAYRGTSDTLLRGSRACSVRDRTNRGRLRASSIRLKSLGMPNDTVECLLHLYPASRCG